MSFAEGYIDVATRIAEFRAKYPDGSLQPADLSRPFALMEIGGKQRLVVVAAAYRSPDDPRPGIGMAYEEVPGKTPYTRDSELQNAETSAWGRAIVAVLAADTKQGVASADEVRNRQADRDVQVETPRRPAKKAQRGAPPAGQDPWQAAEGETPPTPPESRTTDVEWLEGVLERIEAADAPALNEIHHEAAGKHREGKLTSADRDLIGTAITTRKEAIARAAQSAVWPEPAEIPS